MADVKLRKTLIQVETIYHEGGPAPEVPQKRAAALAVIENPFAGGYTEDIAPFMKDLEPLGVQMAGELIAALGGDATAIEGYGKGAIVGVNGEVEHGALWHVPGGYAMRDSIEKSMAIVPSTKKVGAAGTRLDVPVTHTNASYVRSHYDAVEVGIPDAPRPDELVLVLVMTTGGRVHARVGGLTKEDVKGEDGLR
ncbi:amino acid synthesis family protein [Salipiger sp. P9]|uniref:amino acid synthesis family protein n=1 Tax=Salipiger pentaromativorans TaxID=2943193 RepID=UPI002158396D|nr:amino acid synthesis family protein [Salipiger pentaromativorans]MCR8546336.1 amino acid synthesis family protein [Salipiger pentaromativorans]